MNETLAFKRQAPEALHVIGYSFAGLNDELVIFLVEQGGKYSFFLENPVENIRTHFMTPPEFPSLHSVVHALVQGAGLSLSRSAYNELLMKAILLWSLRKV